MPRNDVSQIEIEPNHRAGHGDDGVRERAASDPLTSTTMPYRSRTHASGRRTRPTLEEEPPSTTHRHEIPATTGAPPVDVRELPDEYTSSPTCPASNRGRRGHLGQNTLTIAAPGATASLPAAPLSVSNGRPANSSARYDSPTVATAPSSGHRSATAYSRSASPKRRTLFPRGRPKDAASRAVSDSVTFAVHSAISARSGIARRRCPTAKRAHMSSPAMAESPTSQT
jgi:hypothetical protein